jgi:hypothetical protein
MENVCVFVSNVRGGYKPPNALLQVKNGQEVWRCAEDLRKRGLYYVKMAHNVLGLGEGGD